MKSLTQLLNEAMADKKIALGTFNIIIEYSDKEDIPIPLTEGKWQLTEFKDYLQRTEQHNNGLRHTHIAHKKHKNTKTKQVAWNEDGTKHDRLTFNNSFVGMNKAKEIARKALKLPPNIQLEHVNIEESNLLLESFNYSLSDGTFYVFRINPLGKQVL